MTSNGDFGLMPNVGAHGCDGSGLADSGRCLVTQSRTRRSLLAVSLGVTATLGAQEPRRPVSEPTAADLRYALGDTAYGWIAYRSDGSARSDSARRVAAAGMWDLEGGDRSRGIRLVHAALRLGVADPEFYRDAGELMTAFRCLSEAVGIFEESRRRWPRTQWADSGYTRAVAARQRATEAELHRVCPIGVRALIR